VESLKHADISRVAAGEHHSLALNLVGTHLYSFGRADYGQLGLGDKSTGESVTEPTVVHFPPVPGTDPPEPQILLSIAAADRQSMAISVENNLYTWGFNETGATGHPSVDGVDITVPTLLNVEEHIKTSRAPHARVYEISGGGQHTLMLIKKYR
jgi:regulator of chromosome condensation